MRAWLLRLLQAPTADERRAVPAVQVRCPKCTSIEGVPALNIRAYSIAHDGKVIEETVGYRVCCQRCECIYSIGPTGVFKHHPQSSPLTPEVRRGLDADETPDGTPELPPHSQRPIPRKAPRV